MQNAWMRALAMRVKSDFSFFCNPKITASLDLSSRPISTGLTSAQVVLDECEKIVNASLVDLYDFLTMQANLLKAHQALGKAVYAAYSYKAYQC